MHVLANYFNYQIKETVYESIMLLEIRQHNSEIQYKRFEVKNPLR